MGHTVISKKESTCEFCRESVSESNLFQVSIWDTIKCFCGHCHDAYMALLERRADERKKDRVHEG
jgi:hypothetical protein